MNDRDVLNYNPFEGDRDSNVRLLSDRMLVGRKQHECTVCWGPVAKGERHRARAELDRDDQCVKTFHFCALCCEAMAKSWTDAGKDICARTSLGIGRAREFRDEAAADLATLEKQLSDTHRPEQGR